MDKLKIVFMGSPEIAVPALKALAEHFDVVGVVTQPDREAGRGKKIVMPAVKEAALALNIPVIQPERMKVPGTFEQLEAWAPDLIVVMAFGQILRKNVLELPRLGCLNAHASLLPRWRGASPIQAAILNGDTVSGVTIMQMDPGIDTGPRELIPARCSKHGNCLLNPMIRLLPFPRKWRTWLRSCSSR